VRFRALSETGRASPGPANSGRKDRVAANGTAGLLVRFDDPADARHPRMDRCRILEHEDHGRTGR
jgi:FtsP/CotA-like multicopper oxidase with cupredoxin domain